MEPEMAQEPIGQRIKYLIDVQKISVRRFAQALDIGETNVRNYIDKGTKPSSDVLEKIAHAFPSLNLTWLLTGLGKAFPVEKAPPGVFIENVKKNSSSPVVGTNNGQITYTLTDCEKERDTVKALLDKADNEIQLLREQLQRADALVAAKDETISLLKGAYRNPN